MVETAKSCDLQAEAQIDWWRDAHDLAEARRLQLTKTCERALAHLEKSLEEDDFGDVWEHWQKARKMLRRELGR